MFCPKCGAQLADDARFCPSCGTEVKAFEPAPAAASEPDFSQATVSEPIFAAPTVETASKKSFREFLLAHNNQLFLVLCILFSVNVGASLIAGESALRIQVFPCLYTIFLWILFAKARSKTLDPKPIRWISITHYVSYIIDWVSAGLLALAAILMFVGSASIGNILGNLGTYAQFISMFGSLGFGVLGFVLLLVAAAVALINWFGNRRIVNFLRSFASSAESDTEVLTDTKEAITWVLVFGIVSAVGAVFSITGNFLGFIGSGCGAAAQIVGYLLLKQMFLDAPKAQ